MIKPLILVDLVPRTLPQRRTDQRTLITVNAPVEGHILLLIDPSVSEFWRRSPVLSLEGAFLIFGGMKCKVAEGSFNPTVARMIIRKITSEPLKLPKTTRPENALRDKFDGAYLS